MSDLPRGTILAAMKDAMCAEGLRIVHDIMDEADAARAKPMGHLQIPAIRAKGIALSKEHGESCPACAAAAGVGGFYLVSNGHEKLQ